MDIIKSLPVASRLTSGLADDLEVFFPEWLSTLLPFYNEARNGSDFAFHMMNTCGSGSSYTVGVYDFCRTRHYYGNGYHTLLSSTVGTDSSDLTGRRCSGRVMAMNHPSMTR